MANEPDVADKSSEEFMKRLSERVTELYLRHDYEGALECCNTGLALDPDNMHMQLHKGLTLQNLGRFAEALKWHEIVLKKHPNHEFGIPNKICCLIYMKKIGKANKFTSVKIRENSDNAALLTEMGRVLLALNQHHKALECHEAALKIKPNDIDVITSKALSLHEIGRSDEAMECHEATLEIEPNNMLGVGAKIERLFRQNKIREANEYIDAKIRENHNNITLLSAMGELLQEADMHSEAAKCYDAILKIKPDDVDTIDARASSIHETGYSDDAAKYRKTALENRNYALEIKAKMRDLFDQNKIMEANEYMDEKIKENSNNANVLVNLGDLLQAEDRHAEAAKCYDAVLKILPNDLDATIGMARSLYELERVEDAMQCLDRLLETEYNEALALEKGKMLEMLGRHKDALVCYYRAWKTDPTDVVLLAAERVKKKDFA